MESGKHQQKLNVGDEEQEGVWIDVGGVHKVGSDVSSVGSTDKAQYGIWTVLHNAQPFSNK